MKATEAEAIKNSPLIAMSERLGVDPEWLRKALMPAALKSITSKDIMAVCAVCNEYNLNPFPELEQP